MIGVVSAALLTSAGAVNATPTKNTIYVDGTKVNGAAYMINNNNYFKLRDVAAMVNGSTKQFEVSWNETNKRIDLTTNKAYTVVGGEMALPSSAVKTAKESKASVFKDGNKADYTGKTCLLLETPEAVEIIDDILDIDGIDEIHIGLNDLHLGYKMKFMFVQSFFIV